MRPYVNSYQEPGEGYEFVPENFRNGKRDGYEDKTESGTVPGEAYGYTVELSERITPNGTLVITCGGDVLNAIKWGHNPGANSAAVNYDLGLVSVHGDRDGETISVEYTPGGSPITAAKWNELQRAIVALGEGGGGGGENPTGTTSSVFTIGVGGDGDNARFQWGDSGPELVFDASVGSIGFNYGSDISFGSPFFYGSVAKLMETVATVSTTAAYPADTSLLLCDTTAGGFTVTLPAATTVGMRRKLVNWDPSLMANSLTISRAGTDTISSSADGPGATSVVSSLPYLMHTFTCVASGVWLLEISA